MHDADWQDRARGISSHSTRIAALLSLLVLAACSDSGGGEDDATDSALDPTGDALPGEPFVEVPIGEPASATIGSAGGSLTSTDGQLVLEVPAGALTADTPIEIQQIEWEGGLAWSLSPDGATFAVPVVILVPAGPRSG